jgi:hypothetical protein
MGTVVSRKAVIRKTMCRWVIHLHIAAQKLHSGIQKAAQWYTEDNSNIDMAMNQMRQQRTRMTNTLRKAFISCCISNNKECWAGKPSQAESICKKNQKGLRCMS